MFSMGQSKRKMPTAVDLSGSRDARIVDVRFKGDFDPMIKADNAQNLAIHSSSYEGATQAADEGNPKPTRNWNRLRGTRRS
jgi:hypothetical protein